MLKVLAEEERTVILYESPHRLIKTLRELAAYFGQDRKAAVCRELTKMFEETNINTVAMLATHYELHPPKGEIVIIIEGNRRVVRRMIRAVLLLMKNHNCC